MFKGSMMIFTKSSSEELHPNPHFNREPAFICLSVSSLNIGMPRLLLLKYALGTAQWLPTESQRGVETGFVSYIEVEALKMTVMVS